MRVLFLLILGVVSIFAYELSIKREFKSAIEPDKLRVSFSIAQRAKALRELQDSLNPLSKSLQEFKVCSGGSYAIEPLYNYANNSREFKGYEGRIELVCRGSNIEELDEVIEFLGTKKSFMISQSPLEWVVDPQTVILNKQTLELKALEYAKEYVTMLKNSSIASCQNKKLEIFSYNQPMFSRAMSSEAKTTKPTKEHLDVTIEANYIFECNN